MGEEAAVRAGAEGTGEGATAGEGVSEAARVADHEAVRQLLRRRAGEDSGDGGVLGVPLVLSPEVPCFIVIADHSAQSMASFELFFVRQVPIAMH